MGGVCVCVCERERERDRERERERLVQMNTAVADNSVSFPSTYGTKARLSKRALYRTLSRERGGGREREISANEIQRL